MKKYLCISCVIFLLFAVSRVAEAGNRADTTELKKGDKSQEFVFKGAEGKEHTLREFRGKYVYIDVWASWCYPCRKEYPYFRELKEKFKGKNIEFVGISSDHVIWRWQGSLQNEKMDGHQWWIAGDESSMIAFRCAYIPRFILLDRKGRVLELKMTRPSDPETEKKLRKLKGI